MSMPEEQVNRRVRQRGSALFYLVVVMPVVLALISFGVDVGHVQLVKIELQSAADSAARAASSELSNGTTAAQTAAVQVAASNTADGSAVTLTTAADVEFGNWDSSARTFTVLNGSFASSANAVRVTARRTAARGNAVRMYFASMFGYPSFDVSAVAIASKSASSGGYIGISLTRMYNTAHFDAYNSSSGTYSAASSVSGNLLSFNDLWLYDTSSVKGEAHWDTSGTFNHDATAIVSGTCSAQTLNPNFPAVSLGNVATVNDNAQLTQYYSSNQLVIPDNKPTVTYPGGTYYFTKFDLGTGNTVRFSGPTIIYLKCGGDITSNIAASSLKPADLSIKVVPGYNWKIDAGGVFYGSFYNPTGDVHHHNGGVSYGSVISDLLCFRQDSEGHQDLALGKYAVAAGVTTVK
jgi:Flp pilus assembly protein TadG